MALQDRYIKRKHALLTDSSVCPENRSIFRAFFEFEERKLKRQNGLAQLDSSAYMTLYKYVILLRNVNSWFNNKPWTALTREDIQKVYDDLEDGHIKNKKGLPVRDKNGYYNKILRSKPFRLAGKAELAKEVIEYSVSVTDSVRFVTEDTFRRMVSVVSNPYHALLFWLQWDIGENVGTLLRLTKKHFKRQVNPHTQEAEYLVYLPHKLLKRSRQWRSEPTLHPETVKYLDMIIPYLQEDTPVFQFGHRQALKIIKAVTRKSGAKCEPNSEVPTWKDLRSGMACHLLKCGWSREEIDARLGHSPGSQALNKYINYLAIGRNRSKNKTHQFTIDELRRELEESKQREKLVLARLKRQETEFAVLKNQVKGFLARTENSLCVTRAEQNRQVSTPNAQ